MANTSEAISHQVAAASAKRQRETRGGIVGALGQTKVAASAKSFSKLYNDYLYFWPFGSLNHFWPYDLCRFMAKRQLHSLVALKIDQVMLAIESVYTAHSFVPPGIIHSIM